MDIVYACVRACVSQGKSFTYIVISMILFAFKGHLHHSNPSSVSPYLKSIREKGNTIFCFSVSSDLSEYGDLNHLNLSDFSSNYILVIFLFISHFPVYNWKALKQGAECIIPGRQISETGYKYVLHCQKGFNVRSVPTQEHKYIS